MLKVTAMGVVVSPAREIKLRDGSARLEFTMSVTMGQQKELLSCLAGWNDDGQREEIAKILQSGNVVGIEGHPIPQLVQDGEGNPEAKLFVDCFSLDGIYTNDQAGGEAKAPAPKAKAAAKPRQRVAAKSRSMKPDSKEKC